MLAGLAPSRAHLRSYELLGFAQFLCLMYIVGICMVEY
jgi:hypothetical protein